MEAEYLVSQIYIQTHPNEATRLLESVSAEDAASFLGTIAPEIAVEIIEQMSLSTAIRILESLAVDQASAILKHFHIDIITLFLRRLNTPLQNALLNILPNQLQSALQLRLSYPEGSAGALMDPQILTLPPDISASDALTLVRKHADQVIYYLYVINQAHQLIGVLNMRELMIASPNALISTLMHTQIEKISVRASYQTILHHAGWQLIHAIPVVDDNNVFQGTIRYETLRRIEQDLKTHVADEGLQNVGSALGELYRIGFSGLLNSTIQFSRPQDASH